MKIKLVKLNKESKVPKNMTSGSSGSDLTATKVTKKGWLFPLYTYHTGLKMKIPKGYAGLLFPRSSVSKIKLFLSNGVGVLDPK